MSRLVPGSWPVQVVRSSGCVHQPLEDKAHLWKGPEGQHASLHPGCTWQLPKGQGVPPAGGLRKPQMWKVSVRWLHRALLSLPTSNPKGCLGGSWVERHLRGSSRENSPSSPPCSLCLWGLSSSSLALWPEIQGRGHLQLLFPLWEGHTAQACFPGS